MIDRLRFTIMDVRTVRKSKTMVGTGRDYAKFPFPAHWHSRHRKGHDAPCGMIDFLPVSAPWIECFLCHEAMYFVQLKNRILNQGKYFKLAVAT